MEFSPSDIDDYDAVQNLIAILRVCKQIEASKENVEKNPNCGECDDRIIVTF